MKDNNTDTLDVPKEQTIALWNPGIAFAFSLLFSPIFTIWIYVKNWESLNQKTKAKQTMLWIYGIIALEILDIIAELPSNFTPTLFVGVLWFFVSGRKQIKYIDENNIKYRKKSWGKPILVALGVIGIIFLLLMINFAFTH